MRRQCFLRQCGASTEWEDHRGQSIIIKDFTYVNKSGKLNRSRHWEMAVSYAAARIMSRGYSL